MCDSALGKCIYSTGYRHPLSYWYIDSSKYIYCVKGLRVDDEPSLCTANITSRWICTDGACSSDHSIRLDNSTETFVIAALQASIGGDLGARNPNIRDIVLSNFMSDNDDCDLSQSAVGASVDWTGGCWQHAHPKELNVYDFNMWVLEHPGTAVALKAERRDPICRWAETGMAFLEYPGWHPMDRWDDNFRSGTYFVGRLNDTIDFLELPVPLQTVAMADRIGASSSSSSVGFEACGSRGEVANNNSLGARYLGDSTDRANNQGLDSIYRYTDMSPTYTWQTVALNANDQLRQRVAWALAQFIVATAEDVNKNNVEPFTNFHDIFVHHAFGNYRDILREISTSPVMASFLTFLGNKAFSWDRKFPDENYAREIMQLFTIGV